jgi:hypothetical protein
MIVTSSEENLLTAPANSTSIRNNPFGPVTYGFPLPIRGMGQFDPLSAGVMAGIGVGSQVIQTIFNPTLRGRQQQDATTIVNAAEIYLKMNLNDFMGSPKTLQDKVNALAVFDGYWAQVVQGCTQLARAGTNCVNDRAPGGKFDWFRAYRDPIANSTVTGGSTISTSNVSGGGSPSATSIVDTVSRSIGVSSGVGEILLIGLAAIMGIKLLKRGNN